MYEIPKIPPQSMVDTMSYMYWLLYWDFINFLENHRKFEILAILLSLLAVPKLRSNARNELTGHIKTLPIDEFRSDTLTTARESPGVGRNSENPASK